ncbi:hypothetical protein [Enterobacter asburiae]|uniref:hypothetical protein n=1 Tax=Enterobacter asburiae TaxID=61645 RepID=UPI001A16C6E1|nr:hypothetical protein [Enterobacter cloacae]EKX4146340.1 hypothetical protein [Enterobacter cloacae]
MGREYPDSWDKFCKIERNYGGFTHYRFRAGITIGDLNRFAARYALAADFEGVMIKNSTKQTNLGYEALMRSLLVWSAVESYYYVLPTGSGGKYNYLSYTFSEENALTTTLKKNGSDLLRFYTYISSSPNVEVKHRTNVQDFLSGNNYNPIYLLSSIRHAFGHGELSAHVDGVNPQTINNISKILKTSILEKINDHFSSLVRSHPNYSNV